MAEIARENDMEEKGWHIAIYVNDTYIEMLFDILTAKHHQALPRNIEIKRLKCQGTT